VEFGCKKSTAKQSLNLEKSLSPDTTLPDQLKGYLKMQWKSNRYQADKKLKAKVLETRNDLEELRKMKSPEKKIEKAKASEVLIRRAAKIYDISSTPHDLSPILHTSTNHTPSKIRTKIPSPNASSLAILPTTGSELLNRNTMTSAKTSVSGLLLQSRTN
jgi:hypothetical protein